MKDIGKRIQKLESVMIRPAAFDRWGRMAAMRDDLIRRAPHGCQAELRLELEELGPARLWSAIARHFLANRGFVQAACESFAETMARALDISAEDLRVLISQGRIGKALLARFGWVDGHEKPSSAVAKARSARHSEISPPDEHR